MKTRILRNLSLVAALAMSGTVSAQVPASGFYPEGHVVTDLDGDSHDVDAILNSGKAIVMDAFADWCPPCWTYHNGGVLEALHHDLAYVEVMGMEADPSVPASSITDAGTGMGDWSLGGTIEYILADDDEVAGNLELSYYPTIVLVCPDGSVTEVGQSSYATWKAAILNCPGLVTGVEESEAITFANVYPNPATESANVQFNVAESANTSIELLNALGQVVVAENLGQVSGVQNVSLNTASIENGMYIVRITAGENIVTKSLAINK